MYKSNGAGTRWKIEIPKAPMGQQLQVLTTSIKLSHIGTGAHLSCQPNTLPDWGLGQFEVSGIKGGKNDDAANWTVESHLNRFCKTSLAPLLATRANQSQHWLFTP